MRLLDLFVDLALTPVPLPPDVEISSVVMDSREVGPGSLFIAVRGEKADGFDFVGEAQTRGAAAIVSDRPRPEGISVPWIPVENCRRAAALLSFRFFGDPASRMTLAGVTGTNGKTTTAVLLEGIFTRAFGASGFLGTVGYRWKGRSFEASRTTPEAPRIASLLARMLDDHVKACALEVSSHALALERVAGLSFDAAVFTNLTRDHFDFHRDFEGYFLAKKRLFDLRKRGAAGIINTDDPFGRRLMAEIGPPRFSFSPSGDAGADFRASDPSLDLSGTRFTAEGPGGRFRIESPLAGRFNVENLLAAWSAAESLGIPPATVLEELAANPGAPGRMERVSAGQPFTILVDYAHTEDALRRLLSAVRELTDKTLILVFGCGGDRDPGKREPMGRAAAELSDIPIATSDNPRGEDPAAILQEVERGLKGGGASKYLKLADRREAIATAIELANSRSVLVIAGKGHETYQIVGEQSLPFDDREVAAECVRRSRRATPS
jgi:UDP-N-acetylmuramoyl-L-alanyl-D-glutamate--2,6-diaminopimelate ligase